MNALNRQQVYTCTTNYFSINHFRLSLVVVAREQQLVERNALVSTPDHWLERGETNEWMCYLLVFFRLLLLDWLWSKRLNVKNTLACLTSHIPRCPRPLHSHTQQTFAHILPAAPVPYTNYHTQTERGFARHPPFLFGSITMPPIHS